MPALRPGKRSQVITLAAAGTLTLAAAISAAALTLPPGTVAAPASAAAAYLTVINGHPGAARTIPAAEVRTAPSQDEISLDARQQARELAIIKASVARAVAARAAAARAAARAAAEQAAAEQAAAEQAAAATPAASAPAVTVQAAPAASGAPQEIAVAMLGQYGWPGSQFSCLEPLWARESGWSVTAENPGSGAYGIPQAMPGSEMASAGPDWQADASTQIRWGLTYIEDRYGSPCGAWAHEEATGWY